MRIIESIKQRKSIRTFDGRRLSEKDAGEITAFIENELKKTAKGIRFVIINIDDEALSDIRGLASYGTLKNVKTILACVKSREMSLIDYGYTIEKLVLYTAGKDIATCWIGGSFVRSAVSTAVGLAEGETLPVILPLGYEAEKQSNKSMLIRYMIKADRRMLFDSLFFDSEVDIPLSTERAGKFYEVLEMVRIAPSASNKQPWRIVMNPDGDFDFYLCRNKGYGKGMGYDIQMIDMGIAMCHFELAARELGLKGKFKQNDKHKRFSDLMYITTFKA